MAQKTHVMHGRDHQHGGADPFYMAFEDVGAGVAAPAANLPWGYARAPITNIASGATIQIDFNPAVSAGVGYTSGDPDITLVALGPAGRWMLVIHNPGMYLLCVAASFHAVGSIAAGATGYINTQWGNGGARISGNMADLFKTIAGLSGADANPGMATVYNAGGVSQTVPHGGDTAVVQNSGQVASGNVWQFAVKLSSINKTGAGSGN